MTNSRSEQAAPAALASAREYAGRGWAVLPLHTPEGDGCSCRRSDCKSVGKHPRTQSGLTEATTDVGTIERWWSQWPDANVGIRTGNGLVVLDVDPRHGGDDTLAELERAHGELPNSVECLTGGGGRHIYFSGAGRNSAGALGVGLDVRGDGGYIAAPPSVHATGRPYEWEVSHDPEETPLAPLPGWLTDALASRANTSSNGDRPDGEPVTIGGRNAHLTSLAGTMRRRGMTAQAIAAALDAQNLQRCQPPLDQREVDRIAESVGRYEPDRDESQPFALPALTARQVCELPDPPQSDELLGPLVMRGARLVLGGHTGDGKTTMALALVRAIALGEPFLDWRGAPGRALVIDAEQGLKTVKRRLREAGLDDCEAVDYVRVPDGLSLDRDERHIAAAEELLATRKYAVVACDPLYKLHAGDSNAEREAVDLMRRFDAWRETYRFALVLPVHCRKPLSGTKFTMHEFFGSSAYLRGAEVVLGLQRVRDGYSRLHFFKDRDGDLPIGAAWGLLFDREGGYRRDPHDEKPKQNARDKIAEILEAQPGMTEAALMEATGYAERTIRKALKDLSAVSNRAGKQGPKLWVLGEEDDE